MEKMMIDCEYFKEPCYVPKNLCTIDSHGGIDDVISCAEYCEDLDGDCSKCEIQKCFKRLAEYEEIGLTPEQIREVDKLYAEKCKEVAELKKYTFTGMEMANIAISMQKLREYQELENAGLIIRLGRLSHEAAGERNGNGNCT